MQYDYCPKCGTKYGEQKQADQFACGSCGFVLYLNSKATGSALIVKDGKILLGRRGYEPEKGKWDVIGGFLEYGEDPAVGAIREVKEETNLDVEVESFLGIFMDKYAPNDYYTLNVAYVVKIVGGEPKAGDDVVELKWFGPEELPSDLAFKNGRDMLEAWKKEIKA